MFTWKSLAICILGISLIEAAQQINRLPNRIQWGNNHGYCGEVSFIQAGMYYGQYMSQYDSRSYATPGVNHGLASSQLLLGVNDNVAARNMGLRITRWIRNDTWQKFLLWIKQQVVQNKVPVTIGVFMNQFAFYGRTSGGDSEYDHIVTVYGIDSANLNDFTTFNANDKIMIDDHSLYGSVSNFTFDFGTFAKSRSDANQASAPVYSLSPNGNYGAAILGLVEDNAKSVRISVETNLNYEREITAGSNTRPQSIQLQLTAYVKGLTAGEQFFVYIYDKTNTDGSIPALNGAKIIDATADSNGSWSQTLTIQSHQQVFFRASRK